MTRVGNSTGGARSRQPLIACLGITEQITPYIPLDYFQSWTHVNNIEDFKSKINLEFIPTLERGGVIKKEVCKFNNIKIEVYPSGRVKISGSLHKFWNGGEHNYNQFDFNAFRDVLRALEQLLHVPLDKLHLTQLEYGVNVSPEFDIETFLNHLLFLGQSEFEQWMNSREGHLKKSTPTEHEFKIYNKGKHYNTIEPILRIERKIKVWCHRERYNQKLEPIETLADVLDNFHSIWNDFFKMWNGVTFYDWGITNQRWLKYRDPNFWRQLNKGSKHYHKKQLQKLNENEGLGIKKQLDNLILETLTRLHKNRTCPVTGLNISNQRCDSKLLSVQGVRFHALNTPQTYQTLKAKFLTSNWRNVSREKQILEIAHNIRNRYYNQMRRSQPHQLNLFS